MDFLSDQLFDGRTIRVLTVVENTGDRRAAELSRRRRRGDAGAVCDGLWSAEAYSREVWALSLGACHAALTQQPVI
jgi:hypothetical protein